MAEEYEEYAFPRSLFPYDFRGHTLRLVANKSRRLIDDRIDYHLTVYCVRCDEEKTVRGRLPPGYSEEWRVAVAKLAVLGAFADGCQVRNRKTYTT